MYHPTTRVLTVLELLQARSRITGVQLAERLEVDVRTIRRYVAMLQELGIPVMAERGRYGAYRLMPGFKLPPLMFTDDEALALTLGLLAARRLGLALVGPATEGALAKIERVLPLELRGRVQALRETLTLDLVPPSLEAAPTRATVVALTEAIQQGRRVWMRYATAGTTVTEREVDPYGLMFRTGRWYAPGYCHLRHDLRVFRLDRVRQIELRADGFTRPVDFDTRAFVLHSMATMPGIWQVRVLLRMPLAAAQRLVSPAIAMLAETAEGVELRGDTENLDWMARYLVGLGCPFTVREPKALRKQLAVLAAELAEAAQG